MILNLKLVRVDTDYCEFLRRYDTRVAYNIKDKKLRPFIGVLFMIEDYEYFAPLSSPKPKHLKMKNTIDFFKIRNGELGVVNFNNMIPVMNNNYKVINLNDLKDKKYSELLRNQIDWLNEHYDQVKNKSYKLYSLHTRGRLGFLIMARCCNFKLLEKKCQEYNKITVH